MRLLLCAALLLASTASAQPCASVPKPPSQTAYWAAHAAKMSDTTQPAIIFLGDSISERWETDGASVWAADFEPIGGWTCGGSGDTTSSLLYRVGDGVLADRGTPDWVVILIGTNQLAGSDSAWWIWHGIMRVMQAVRQRLPAPTRLLVVSILPRSTGWTKRATVNGYLADSVAKECDAVFLDVEADFSSGGALLPGLYQADGVHLTEAGYAVLADRIFTVIEGG